MLLEILSILSEKENEKHEKDLQKKGYNIYVIHGLQQTVLHKCYTWRVERLQNLIVLHRCYTWRTINKNDMI